MPHKEERGLIRHTRRLLHVVRHDDDRERLLEFKDAFLKALRCNRIQSTAGLIHQKHFGFNRQRTCNAEALLLAAGKPQGTVVKTVLLVMPATLRP